MQRWEYCFLYYWREWEKKYPDGFKDGWNDPIIKGVLVKPDGTEEEIDGDTSTICMFNILGAEGWELCMDYVERGIFSSHHAVTTTSGWIKVNYTFKRPIIEKEVT